METAPLEKPKLLSVPETPNPRKSPPALYERDASKYAGPHHWQITAPAKLLRQMCRQRAYTRWYEQACSEICVAGIDSLNQALVADQPGIFIANHASHLDTVIINEVVPPAVRRRLFFGAAQDRWFVKGRKKLKLKPWYQSLVLGNFPIMRGGGRAALSYASWLLQQRQHVMLFPEGTRAMDGNLGEFRHGATLLALQHNVPIYPIYLGGLDKLQPKGQREMCPGPVYVEFLNPIQFSAGGHVAAATQLLASRMNDAHRRFTASGKTAEPRTVPEDDMNRSAA